MGTQFYVGQVVEPEDLFFRDECINELWEVLEKQHAILTAPRRTGKTSVMTHLLHKPADDWLVLYLNVQDTSNPADFYLQFLDEFNTRDPGVFRKLFSKGGLLINKALTAVDSVEVSSLKVAIRDNDKELANKWRDRLDDLLARIRVVDCKVLIILDELPDMLLAMKKEDQNLLMEFLGWFRKQRLNPMPSRDSIRWLIGGSINLMGTLDAMGLVDRMNDPEVVQLPIFTPEQVGEFVGTMLSGQGCIFNADVPAEVAKQLGRPIPLFMQMATQELYRIWRKEEHELTVDDVTLVFNNLVTSPEARDKLQHYHSRIAHYYDGSTDPAYALLNILSLSENGASRKLLRQKYDELQFAAGIEKPDHEESRAFNEIMLHLENDFYIVETEEDRYDFSGGLLKAWWRKYYA